MHPLQAAIPKQYLELRGQPIATYSMQMFAAMPQVRPWLSRCLVACKAEHADACGHAAGAAAAQPLLGGMQPMLNNTTPL